MQMENRFCHFDQDVTPRNQMQGKTKVSGTGGNKRCQEPIINSVPDTFYLPFYLHLLSPDDGVAKARRRTSSLTSRAIEC